MLNFDLERDSLYIRNTEDGEQVNLRKKGISALKVIKLSPEKLKIEFKNLPCQRRFGISEGCQAAPDSGFLRCAKETVRVKSNPIVNVSLVPKIPDEQEYRENKYALIIKAELKEMGVSLELYGRV